MIILIWVIGENWSKSTVEKDKIGEGKNSPISRWIREKSSDKKWNLRYSIFTKIRLFNFWFWLILPFSKSNFGQFSLLWHLILTDFRFFDIWFRLILAFSILEFNRFSLFSTPDFGSFFHFRHLISSQMRLK